ncbi:MAG: hypothetical protein SWC96_08170 [Thermodesulfobacteriota bacterium]|nr:hypothetical protein [Thermodesulfobacteriota bacterium]
MKKVSAGILAVWFCLAIALPCLGMGNRPPFDSRLVARAEVDECFNGIGNPYEAGPDCYRCDDPKANQTYVWGLTKAGSKLWFGTCANMLCLLRAFNCYSMEDNTGGTLADLLSNVSPYQNDLWVCEYDEGLYPKTEMISSVPDIFGDYRPPKIYTYDIKTEVLTDMTGTITADADNIRLENTFGLRSAAAIDDMVFLSGPVALGQGINMFVFDAVTGSFIASATLPQYQNIRKWLVLNDVLYAAVANEDGGGKVLRWTGDRSSPFSFDEVGVLDGGGSEIVAHDGRIFVGTWPSRTEENAALGGIWMSPKIQAGGLTITDYNSWEKVWEADEYEPDPLNASIYGVGAMASFGGYLYWGTMHVHGKAASVFMQQYNMKLFEFPLAYVNSWRATSIFRGKCFDSDKKVELLYGNDSLRVYVPNGDSSGYWTSRKNNMGGVSGKYGAAGFGNMYNNYTWTMAVYDNQLFVGTMDHSYLWLDWDGLQRYYISGEHITLPRPQINWWYTPSENEYGADLWRFPSTNAEAERVSRDGLGNYTNYGFRSSIVDEDTGLYIGTANPASLHTDNCGNINGGWELIRVYKND